MGLGALPGFNLKALRAGFETPGLDLSPQGWIGAPRAGEEGGGVPGPSGELNRGTGVL